MYIYIIYILCIYFVILYYIILYYIILYYIIYTLYIHYICNILLYYIILYSIILYYHISICLLVDSSYVNITQMKMSTGSVYLTFIEKGHQLKWSRSRFWSFFADSISGCPEFVLSLSHFKDAKVTKIQAVRLQISGPKYVAGKNYDKPWQFGVIRWRFGEEWPPNMVDGCDFCYVPGWRYTWIHICSL